MNKCLKCGKNCEKEYCWKCSPKKPLKKSAWGLTFNNMNTGLIQTSSLKKIKMRVNSNKKKENEDIIHDPTISNGEGVYNNIRMREFFLTIWDKRKIHKCEMCGQGLGNEPLSYMFDHILEKGNPLYRHLMYEEDNIAYLCLLCHDNKTRGFPSENYLQKINETKIKFNIT